MKQKKPSVDDVKNTPGYNRPIMAMGLSSTELSKCMDMMKDEIHFQNKLEEQRYHDIRHALTESIELKSRQHVYLAFLIDQISFLSVMLLRKRKTMMDLSPSGRFESECLVYEREIRKSVELYANLLFAQDRRAKAKSLDHLLAEIEKEDNETKTDGAKET